MNPDVFITIAFVGIAVLTVLVPLVLYLPHVRREAELVKMRESSGAQGTTQSSGPKPERDAPVH
jgi:hypothetical protein